MPQHAAHSTREICVPLRSWILTSQKLSQLPTSCRSPLEDILGSPLQHGMMAAVSQTVKNNMRNQIEPSTVVSNSISQPNTAVLPRKKLVHPVSALHGTSPQVQSKKLSSGKSYEIYSIDISLRSCQEPLVTQRSLASTVKTSAQAQ